MKMTVETQINAIQKITMSGEGKLDECMRNLNAMLAFNGKCGCCQSGDVGLEFKEAKGYQFYEFVCRGCGAKAQWGQYKSGGYFLKKWEKYNPNGPSQVPAQYPDEQSQERQATNEDIPW